MILKIGESVVVAKSLKFNSKPNVKVNGMTFMDVNVELHNGEVKPLLSFVPGAAERVTEWSVVAE